MRPVTLVMEGFGAYRDRTVVDFDGVELFALTGPTGAGKSTVVDAICMALYGSIPRYEDLRLIAPAISQGMNQAMVHLEFVIDGVTYIAVRIIRRTAMSVGQASGVVLAEAWMTFSKTPLVVMRPNAPRIDWGSASSGLVAPQICLTRVIASSPQYTRAMVRLV